MYCCLLSSVFVSIKNFIFLAAGYPTVVFVSECLMAFSLSIINALIKCFESISIA